MTTQKFQMDKFKPRRYTQDKWTRSALVKRQKARSSVEDKLEAMRLEKEFEL